MKYILTFVLVLGFFRGFSQKNVAKFINQDFAKREIYFRVLPDSSRSEVITPKKPKKKPIKSPIHKKKSR